MDIGDAIRADVERTYRAQREALDQECVRMLVDGTRGVLVDGHGVPALSDVVPYGEIWYEPIDLSA